MRRKALKIVQVGDPVLRQKARALTAEEIRSREIRKLIDAMQQTMHDAPGVGLAAPGRSGASIANRGDRGLRGVIWRIFLRRIWP